ncbi:MAG: hypothetical protein SWX82_35010 [Cyanobacteriota bacterium]|nr:hypothetical protein [Cyanobacteriota bacterium]
MNTKKLFTVVSPTTLKKYNLRLYNNNRYYYHLLSAFKLHRNCQHNLYLYNNRKLLARKRIIPVIVCALLLSQQSQPAKAFLGDIIPDIPDLGDIIPDIPDLGDIIPDIPDLGGVIPDLGDIIPDIPDFSDLIDFIPFPNPLENIQDIIAEKVGKIEDFLEGIIPDIGEEVGGILKDNRGILGIPDLNKSQKDVRKKIEEAIGNPEAEIAIQKIDNFNTNSVALEQSINNEMKRSIARAVADAAISKESQETAKNNLEQLAASLTIIKSLNEASQGMDVTQDIIKNQTYIQSEMAKIHVLTFAEVQGLRQIMAADLQVTVSLSEALDEQNRTKRARILSDSNSNLFQATQLQF